MKNRNDTLDLLNFLLALLIILLHCSIFSNFNKLLYYLIVQGVLRKAVPVFFIITEYFFYEFIERSSYKFWLKKIFILYAFWMLVYSPFWFNLYINNITMKLLVGYHHLWYLITTFFSAILLIVYLKLLKYPKGLFIISVILCLMVVFLQYAGNDHFFINQKVIDKLLNTDFMYINFLLMGFPFFSIGYLIRLKKRKLLQKSLISIFL